MNDDNETTGFWRKNLWMFWVLAALIILGPPAVLLYGSIGRQGVRAVQHTTALNQPALTAPVADADFNPSATAVKELRHVDSGGTIRSLAVSHDGQRLLTGGKDQLMRLWDLKTGQQLFSSFNMGWEITAVAFSPDGNTAVAASANQLWVWDLARGRQIQTIHNPSGQVTALAVAPNAQTAITGGPDGNVRVWNLRDGQQIGFLEAMSNIITTAYCAAGGQVAAISGTGQLRVWDIRTGRQLQLVGHGSPLRCGAFSADGRFAAMGAHDRTIKIWDVENNRQVKRFQPQQWFDDFAFSRDAKRLVLSTGNTLTLWDIESAKSIATITVPGRNGLNALSMLPGGRHAVVGGNGWSIVTLCAPEQKGD